MLKNIKKSGWGIILLFLAAQGEAATECDLTFKVYYEKQFRIYNNALGKEEAFYIDELKRSEHFLTKLDEFDTSACSGNTQNELFLLKTALKSYLEMVRPIVTAHHQWKQGLIHISEATLIADYNAIDIRPLLRKMANVLKQVRRTEWLHRKQLQQSNNESHQ